MDFAALTSTDHPLGRILHLANDAIISVDREQQIILFNQGAERIFGYSAGEVNGQRLGILLPQQLADIRRKHINDFGCSSITAGRMGERSIILGRRKNGVEFPAEVSISKVVINNQLMYTVILRDVTDRAVEQEKLESSLREKEALLKEIHHRVKNNLQVVSSLLGLQSRAVADPKMRKVFEESQNRIFSMALIHESLYQSKNLSKLDFPEYIRQLADHLFQSYGVVRERIRLRTEFDQIAFTLETAVPCGLIVNELVSNCLKYAFPEGRAGEICIVLRSCPLSMARLIVSDNGVGFRSDVEWTTTRSLGLRLVRSLANQLGATIGVQSESGTEIHFDIPMAA